MDSGIRRQLCLGADYGASDQSWCEIDALEGYKERLNHYLCMMNLGVDWCAVILRVMKRILLLMAVAAMMLAAPFAAAKAALFEGFVTEKPADKNVGEVVFATNMHCDKCVNKLNENLAFIKGVKDLKVSLKDQTIKIKYDKRKTDEKTLADAIKKLGYKADKVEK